ncbi:MAG: hydrogen gas-evolving membrane-bound hydrogenase subunit E [Acidimicrobiia bacterium]
MTWLLVAHGVVGLAVMAGAPRLGRSAFALGALPMLAALGLGAAYADRILDGDAVRETTSWVGVLDLGVDLRLDGFALLMVLIVSGIGVAVMGYGASYFSPTALSARIAGLLVLFSGSMLGVVLADNLLLLYTFWELTSITSWLLIGSHHTDTSARAGALHALIVTSAGGLAMLAGFVVLGQAAGTYSFSEILADPPSGGAVGIGLGCILVGVVTKSAQVPTHAWLPGAMVAPTPVSAYLHAATMVKAGIYLAARLAPVFAVVGSWRAAVTVIGLATMLHGGLRALQQHDLKLLLAMGTVSQLGFMLVLVGTGRPDATVAGAVLLLAHALFKAALFLVVGIIDHETGTRDRRRLHGFGAGWRPVKAVTLVSAASMAGLPPLFGFVAKEGAYDAFVHEGVWGVVTLAGLVAGSVLTFAYSVRFAAPVLAPAGTAVRDAVSDTADSGAASGAGATGVGTPDAREAHEGRESHGAHAPSLPFVLPALVLAGLTVLVGLAVPLIDPLVEAAAQSLDAGVEPVHLSLWHGLNVVLLLSLLTYGLGVLLVAARHPLARLQEALATPHGADEAFTAAIRGLNATARRVTGVTQSGSLPVYIAVILLTAVAVPNALLALDDVWAGWPRFAETPLQVALAAVVVGAALGAATVARRFAAVLLLGGVGYGVALVFVVQGAPDLALTQFAVETLTLVVFALVLRHLPEHFERRAPAIGTWLRLTVAGAVAAGVFTFALVSAGSRAGPPISGGLIERSLPEGGGRNVVNVILVDFRGLDTLGEISVLVVAGLGVVALARVRPWSSRRDEQRLGERPPDGPAVVESPGSALRSAPVEEAG